MKHMVLFILVLLLTADMAEDGRLGKAKVFLPNPSTKTSVTFSHNHTSSGHIAFRHEPASTDLPGSQHYGIAQPTTLFVPHTLQTMHCCHLGSAGAIPL